jgi:serine/threonine protein kinase
MFPPARPPTILNINSNNNIVNDNNQDMFDDIDMNGSAANANGGIDEGRLNYRDLLALGHWAAPPQEHHRPDHHSAEIHRACTGCGYGGATDAAAADSSNNRSDDSQQRFNVVFSSSSAAAAAAAPSRHRQSTTAAAANRGRSGGALRPPALPPKICLLRDHPSCFQAYAAIDRDPIQLTHRHPEWGCLTFMLVLPRCSTASNTNNRGVGSGATGTISFLAVPPEEAQYVAVKRLKKSIVHAYLNAGGEENPYKEVARMQELGDNEHVLRCIECLEDDNYLYIVTPRGCAEGTLRDTISWFNPDAPLVDHDRVHAIFRKLLRILRYLLRHRIHHHDLSPDNFLFLTPDNLVVFDLALSVRLPQNPAPTSGLCGYHRGLLPPLGNFGTYAWMCPEVYANETCYDGVQMDLYAVGVILYNLLTNQVLYERPVSADIGYAYFVQAAGLSSTPMNERTVHILQVLRGLAEGEGDGSYRHLMQGLIDKATAHLNLSPEAIDLLERILAADPIDRCSLADVEESAFCAAGGAGATYMHA